MTVTAALTEPNAVVPTDLGADDLRELMHAVTATTHRLQQTHTALHGEVTRLKRELADANAQLRRSRDLAALGEMAAGIAHEVRNPLGSIRLSVQMLAEDLSDAPDRVELCEKIGRAVTGLNSVVDDVLLFAREERLRHAPTTARHLFDRALESCHALVQEHAVTVEQTRGGQRLTVDAALLVPALANVIRNAVEAMSEMPPPRRLTLTSETRAVRCPDGRRARRVVLRVADSGPGIDDDALHRMFNPFFTTRPTGTGLGLAIVHRVVDAHGGHIVVTNPPGGGARFDLCLPPTPPGRDGVAEHQEGDP
jgi:signal transduction histidine kinase